MREHLSLSRLLINELYCCKDIVLYLYKGTEIMLNLIIYFYIVIPYKHLGKISDILHLNNENNQLER